jgi:hypothetical protein
MTHRERVLSTFAHSAADRVPIDLGSTFGTGVNGHAHVAPRVRLGLPFLKEWELAVSSNTKPSIDLR